MARCELHTLTASVVIPPRSSFQELVILRGQMTPRQLWVKHGLGLYVELVEVRRPGPRGARLSTWRTFDDAGHVTVAIEAKSRPASLLLVWFNRGPDAELVDWRLTDRTPPRPFRQLELTELLAELEPVTRFESTLAQAFRVAPGELHWIVTEAAIRGSMTRVALLGWLDAQPWHLIYETFRTIQTRLSALAYGLELDPRELATTALFVASTKAMQQQNRS